MDYSPLSPTNLPVTWTIPRYAPTNLPPLDQDRCGYEYTSPLQRMLIDMKVSTDLTKEFEQHLTQKNEKLIIVFSVNILQVRLPRYDMLFVLVVLPTYDLIGILRFKFRL